MRTAAEIEELALLVGRDDLVLRETLDQLDLVGVVAEDAQRLLARHHLAHERFRFLAVGRHAALDLREIVRRQWARQIEVVVEAVLDGGTDPEPGVREDLQHRFRHQVGRRVAHARQLVRPGVLQIDRDVHAGDVVVCVCHLGLSALVHRFQ